MTEYKWKPITPLSGLEREIDLAATRPLYDSWRAARNKLRQSSGANLAHFTQRLVRRLSIETGILEHIYDLDRGTTEALVASGFVEDLVSRSSTDIEPSRLIDILRDQEAAIQLVMDCVTSRRDLTRGVIHELHGILTKHQDTTSAVDQFGKRLEIPLEKGQYKSKPNNPKRPDGSIHEYCPPIHVESEMDNLLNWYKSYEVDDPVIVAAWLHHRFTQIHPYQDGNGRVGRALITLILLRADLLPLIIDRDLRVEYIKALENADHGDLTLLAGIFARLERSAILQALSINTDAEISREPILTAAVIDSLVAKFNRRKLKKSKELRQVNCLAESLRVRTRRWVGQEIAKLARSVNQLAEPEIHVTDGGPDRNNAHWYRFDVIESGRSSGKFINFQEAHYFLKVSIRVGRERLVFVISFHHVGRELSGIMEVTSFSRLESFENSEDRESASKDFFPCSLEPFVITWNTTEDDVGNSFERWLDAAFAVAVKEYGDRL